MPRCPIEDCKTNCVDDQTLFGHVYRVHQKHEIVRALLLLIAKGA